ncbi:fasciclin-1-like [Panonychus citri]|uniref:fasciclin-1-like n=1 Tax=Panonychus citri TaxID=50023 RepID=UPI00230792C4|nr:fasciclin-1-like [Panonychus citri]
MFILSLFLWLSILTRDSFGQNESIFQWVSKAGKYTKFLEQLRIDNPKLTQVINSNFLEVTALIPDNNAFLRFGKSSNDLIAAHLLTNSYNTDSLLKLENVASYDVKRPKLRFTSGFSKTTNKTEVYVLNARILESHKVGDSMVHIIDRVLDPPKATSPVAPLAVEWINNHNIYPSIQVRGGVDAFSSLINSTNAAQYFDCLACTFFVPTQIDSGTANLINRNVIIGHIIPNHVLFLRSMNNTTPYKTKADSNELSVQLFKEVRGLDESAVSYIHSSTKGTLKSMRLGNTRVKVIQGDIPVSNGVVHIIEKPLIITDMSVLDYLKEESSTSLLKFFNLIQEFSSLRSYYSRGDASRPLTLFAFTNEAYESVRNDINILARNRTAMEELMKLHFVDNEVITSQNAATIKEKASLAPNKKLYFSVAADRLYVEGDGVKAATVLQDIACTNGVIHVINKVLGIPSSPIKDKLREDPQLRTTFTVAEKMRSDWINKLGNSAKNFTLFAPSEAAWKKLAEADPSSHKQLVDGLYADNAMNILNRHLVENQAISLENLSSMLVVNTVNSQLQIETKALPGDQKVILKYMQLKSTIVRPDIKAINGYIHEIDTVLMQDSDLKVDPSAVRSSAPFTCVSPAIIFISFAAYILKLF